MGKARGRTKRDRGTRGHPKDTPSPILDDTSNRGRRENPGSPINVVFPCEDVATPLMGSTARNDRGCRALVVQSGAMHKRKSQRTANGDAHPTAGASTTPSLQERLLEKEERLTLVVWRRPFLTLRYFALESIALIANHTRRVWDHKKVMGSLILITICLYFLSTSTGPHQQVVETILGITSWCLWWIWLGILSSVGLGTGLHTFLLYLGPHIASVTMAAYACNSLDFPAPPYPDEIICPEEGPPSRAVSILSIMAKVRLEAFMWGAGTALGELPPYFMARGARLSGYDPDDEEMAEFESLQRLKDRPKGAALSWVDRAKLSVEKLVERVGFIGILACASIPNPLFDLAGVTCGHFLVPFWTFFGATLIGKAVVKMHIQKLFVIVAFNEALLSRAVDTLALVPALGPLLEEPFRAFLEKQRRRFRRQPGSTHSSDLRGSESILSWLFEKLILAMILYFVLSIINSLAQNYHKRMKKRERERKLATD